jgi:type I restriction enzyme S subunit
MLKVEPTPMNADRLLALFETISEAPDAIARLRRFILDLAVRGKLVEQDPGDEPAGELLGAIYESMVFSGRRKRAKALTKPDDAEPFEIPYSWAWVSLGEITDLITSGSRDWAKHYSSDGAIFVRMGNLSRCHYRLRLDSIQHVKPPTGGEGTRTSLQAWDVLVSITGDVGMLGLIPEGFGEAYINQHTALVRPCSLLKGRFLPEVLRSNFVQDQFCAPQRGIKNSFRLSDVANVLIPLPPLAEQHRIVAKVDELMAICDQLEAARQTREKCRERLVAANLQRLNQPSDDPEAFHSDARFALQVLPSLTSTPAQIKQLRQTILNLAVRGKLVEQDPGDEPAELLLQFLQKHGRRSNSSTSKGDSIPFDLPVGWVPATLGDLVQTSNSGWSPKTLDLPREGEEWGILKVSAVSWERFQPDANKQVLPGTQPKPQAVVTKGDFLISRANTAELVARAVIVDCDPVNLMMSDKIVRLHLVELCEPRYILIVNNHATFARGYYASHATGVSPSMKNVSRDVILGLPLPLPPLAEQHRIVAKVDELMALCDQLEQQLSQAEQGRRGLLEAVLREALVDSQADLALEGRA